MSDRPLELEFRAIDEPQPGDKWRALFDEYWPDYEKWFLREGDAARPSRADAERALHHYMPELVPTYERLVALAGDGDRAARFLCLYKPPPIVAGCSQLVRTGDEVALIRNYDHAPHLCDGIVWRSAWSGRSVIALGDCGWGALDGMNEDGLVLALAFGGRPVAGDGFAVTLILRYLLETCGTVAEACAALGRVPAYLSYNVTLADAAGDYATVFVAPDRAAVVERRAVCTNHQGRVEWPAYAQATGSVEREARLETVLAERSASVDALADEFLRPPLYQAGYRKGHGTLYTAVYRPGPRRLELRWPDERWRIGFDEFEERSFTALYIESSAPAAAGVDGPRHPGYEPRATR